MESPTDRAEERRLEYARALLPDLLMDATSRIDCRCRYPDGNGPPCDREQLAAELRKRADERRHD